MGNMQAAGYAEAVEEGSASLEWAVTAHLSSNHFPSIPGFMVGTALAAIEAGDDEEWYREIPLPEGVTNLEGGDTLPAYKIIEQMHLQFFLGLRDDESRKEDS